MSYDGLALSAIQTLIKKGTTRTPFAFYNSRKHNEPHTLTLLFPKANLVDIKLLLYHIISENPSSMDEHQCSIQWKIALSSSPEQVKTLIRTNPRLTINPISTGDYAVHFAAWSGNISALELLKRHGASFNPLNNKQRTPLQIAVLAGNAEAVQFLITKRADPNLGDAQKFTPLHNAVLLGNMDLVSTLIKSGANVNLLDSSSRSPLFFAALANNKEMINFLLESGADASIGLSCYQPFIEQAWLHMVEYLWEHGVKITSAVVQLAFGKLAGRDVCSFSACSHRDPSYRAYPQSRVIEFLIDHMEGPCEESLLRQVACTQMCDAFDLILKRFPDLHFGNMSNWIEDLLTMQTHFVEMFLAHYGEQCVPHLRSHKNERLIDVLENMKKFPHLYYIPDADGLTALQATIGHEGLWNTDGAGWFQDCDGCLRYLLDNIKLNPNCNYDPNTPQELLPKFTTLPVHLAARKSTYHLGILISHGADVNLQDERGMTPLHILIETNNWMSAQQLLRDHPEDLVRTDIKTFYCSDPNKHHENALIYFAPRQL